jgi:radical SAM-linked protein
MQRLRVRYTKLGRVRFLSARDLTSVWERALRRAELPIAYSEGFTPHPKVSFPDALPVGYASTGEYAELTFAAEIDPGRGLGRLSAALPTGMDITTYLTVPDGARKLASYLKATLWEFDYRAMEEAEALQVADELRRRITRLLDEEQVEVVRRRAKGDVTVDLRPSVVAMAASLHDASGLAPPLDVQQHAPVLRAVLRNDGPTVRPSDLANALTRFADLELPDPRTYVRVAQGTWTDEGLVEALTQQVERLEAGRHAEAA